jgi:hypothetical protein
VANVYVYSGAGGAGTGADWANAYTTLAAAFAAKVAGDDFWVAHDHAETQASAMALNSPGTMPSPCRVICVDRGGSVPPVPADLRDTATITTTGANAITIGSNTSVTYFEGIIFSSASGAVSTSFSLNSASADVFNYFNNCALRLGGTSGGNLVVGTTTTGVGNECVWDNTTFQVSAAGSGIARRLCMFTWKNTSSAITGATLSTNLFINSGAGGWSFIEGVDLSALGSGKTLVPSVQGPVKFFFKDCKLGASVTVAATPVSSGNAEVDLIRCDSGDTNYRHERYRYEGTQTVETTVIRTGGASDGTTPIAWKLITTANSKRHLPFEAAPISIWNETVGSPLTLTVEGIWGGGAVPTDADIWMDVEYLGTSGFSLGNFASSGPADQLVAGTNLGAGSGTWGGSTTKFKLEKQITPAEKGPITVYIKAAAASSTFYIDPKITVS